MHIAIFHIVAPFEVTRYIATVYGIENREEAIEKAWELYMTGLFKRVTVYHTTKPTKRGRWNKEVVCELGSTDKVLDGLENSGKRGH